MKDVTVGDVMTHLVVTLKPKDRLEEAAARLARNHVSGMPVIERCKVVGVLSETDLVTAALPGGGSVRRSLLESLPHGTSPSRALTDETVGELMSHPAVTVSPRTSITEAARIMTRRGMNRLPVVDSAGYLTGIVSRGDVVRAIADAGDRRLRDQEIAYAYDGRLADGA